MSDETIDRETAEQTTKNFELAGTFLREALADPALFDKIPEDASVVMMPANDPELAQRNLALATKLAGAGKEIVLYRVGVPAPDVAAWRENELTALRVRELAPRWPRRIAPKRGDLVVVYDRDRDLLLVDFFGLRRAALGIALGGATAIRVEVESQDIVGYLLGPFLSGVVPRAPHLATVLRVAEFRAITDEELGGLEGPPPPAAGPASEREAAEALATEFVRLIA